MMIYPSDPNTPFHSGTFPLLGSPTVACDHCGILAVDTPAFGWKRWHDEDGLTMHHCPAAVQINELIAEGLMHMRAPDEAVEYEFWPFPNLFWLANLDDKTTLGPYVGRDQAIDALNEMVGDARSGTVVMSDAEHGAWLLTAEVPSGN